MGIRRSPTFNVDLLQHLIMKIRHMTTSYRISLQFFFRYSLSLLSQDVRSPNPVLERVIMCFLYDFDRTEIEKITFKFWISNILKSQFSNIIKF